MALLLDGTGLEVQGTAVPCWKPLTVRPRVGEFAFSPSGTLVYVRGTGLEASPRTLVWVNRRGHNGELVYRNGNKIMAVETHTSPVFHAGKPKVLLEKPYGNGYDVTRDAKHFLMVKKQ